MLFAKSTGGFYSRDIHGKAIPADATEITADEYAALLAGQSAGQRIMAGDDGRPYLADPPAPSEAERQASQRQQILAELAALGAAGARPARAIALAVAAGDEPAPADIARLREIEAQAVELRAALAALAA